MKTILVQLLFIFAACLTISLPASSAVPGTAAPVPAGLPAGLFSCDERIDIANPARHPFNTIATIRYDNSCTHNLQSWGTGSLVGPHMLLTAGHVVYNRNAGMKNQTCNYIQPGAYHDSASNQIIYPYGERTIDDVKYKKTNNKWADQSYSPERDVDYGAIHLVCPFEDINTYMPMVFDYAPEFINMSGYPIKDLPNPANGGDQWRDAGDVNNYVSRRMYYDVRSTGGASGAPVWEFSSGSQTRRLVAVNAAHSTRCNGLGPRLVWQNEQLINEWLDWRPTLAEKAAHGCANFKYTPFGLPEIMQAYKNGTFKPFNSKELRLVAKPQKPSAKPSHRVYQFIQNQLFVWDEYLVGDANSKRYIRLLEPQEQWLKMGEATALLSASASWVTQQPSGRYQKRGKIGATKSFPMPEDKHIEGSTTPVDQSIDSDFDKTK